MKIERQIQGTGKKLKSSKSTNKIKSCFLSNKTTLKWVFYKVFIVLEKKTVAL